MVISTRESSAILHTRMLAPPFLARGTASAALAAQVLRGHPDWSTIVRAVSWYAVIDGGLGLIVVVLLISRRLAPRFPLLTGMTIGDAIIRLALGIVLLAFPAIAELPMTLVPLFGVVGLTSAALGLTALVVWTIARHRYHHLHQPGLAAFFDPLATIGFLSVAVGCLLFFDPPYSSPQLRDVIATAGIVLAASYALSAIGALISARRPSTRSRASELRAR